MILCKNNTEVTSGNLPCVCHLCVMYMCHVTNVMQSDLLYLSLFDEWPNVICGQCGAL